jgi:hypothetical protein
VVEAERFMLVSTMARKPYPRPIRDWETQAGKARSGVPIVMITAPVAVMTAMRDAHARRDGGTFDRTGNTANDGAHRPGHRTSRHRADARAAKPFTRRGTGGKAQRGQGDKRHIQCGYRHVLQFPVLS